MKYLPLTTEQLHELHQEFILFLATQQIDKAEWDLIKKEKPVVAASEINIFSDLIWEKVLTNANYLDYYAPNTIVLFFAEQTIIESIIIKTNNVNINFLTPDGMQWLENNIFSNYIEIHKGQKQITNDRNIELFDLIKQGAILSKGEFFRQISQIV